MNEMKKIVSIAIIGMFLLSGLTAVSAVGLKSTGVVRITNDKCLNIATGCLTIFLIGVIPKTAPAEGKIELYDSNENLMTPFDDQGSVAAYRDIPVGEYTIKASAKYYREKTDTVYVEEGDWQNPTIKTIKFTIGDIKSKSQATPVVSISYQILTRLSLFR